MARRSSTRSSYDAASGSGGWSESPYPRQRDGAVAGGGHGQHMMAPRVPNLRETVQEQHRPQLPFACLGYVEVETSDGQMAVLKLNLLVPDHGHLCFGSLEAIATAESRFESFDLRGLRLR